LHSYARNYNPTDHARAREELERAVKVDPRYADAWAALSVAYFHEHSFNFNPRPDPLRRALDAARQAVTLDPTNQPARTALAEVYFFRHELDSAFVEAERAVALNPNNAGVLASMGSHLHLAGDERGIALVRKAMKLDPFHPTWFYFPVVHDHFCRREYDQALAATQRIDMPGFAPRLMWLAAIYAELNRLPEARSALQELAMLYPRGNTETLIGELRKFNYSEDSIRQLVAALRKAGLPE
jgi:tetratricopeptide (TPR) repeat protein